MRIFRPRWKAPRYDGTKPEAPKEEGNDIVLNSRAGEKAILGDSGHPAQGTEKKVSRAERIQSLSLETQFDEWLVEMDKLIKRGVFVLETPMVTREAALNTLTDEQLEMASEYHEPTLLIIPKTSLRAKAAALETAVSIAQEEAKLGMEGLSEAEKSNAEEILSWEKPDMPEEFFKEDSGSERIAGWEVRLVDGQINYKEDYKEEWIRYRRMSKKPLPPEMVDQLKWRHDHGEREIDPHAYAMLALMSLLRGEPIDSHGGSNPKVRVRFTVLRDEFGEDLSLEKAPDELEKRVDPDVELSDKPGEETSPEEGTPVARWYEEGHRFIFGFVKAGFKISKRYRRSVGGEVKP